MVLTVYYTTLIIVVMVLCRSPLPSSQSTEHNSISSYREKYKNPIGWYVPYKSSFCSMEERWEQNGILSFIYLIVI